MDRLVGIDEMSSLHWTNSKRKLSDLTPWPRNPRGIDEAQATLLIKSWDTFNQVDPLAIGPDNQLYDGHQRKDVLSAIERYGPDYEVAVRVSSRPLTEGEREKLAVIREKGSGDWDWDLLADFDKGDLLDWGFDEGEFPESIDDVEFPEYDESVADEVEYIECPDCGAKWPK